MSKENKICQSCGMPLKRDKNGPAYEADGTTPSKKYCTNCYMNGEFTCKECTVKDMQDKNAEIMKKMHFPSFMISAFNKKLTKLERWSNEDSTKNN